jgi:hypothetical protein
VPKLSPRQTFGFHLFKPDLYGGIAIAFIRSDLGNITRPSFDYRHGECNPVLIENLGHSNFSSYQPFKHNQYSPVEKIFRRDCQPGLGCIISDRSTVNYSSATIPYFFGLRKETFLCHLDIQLFKPNLSILPPHGSFAKRDFCFPAIILPSTAGSEAESRLTPNLLAGKPTTIR